MTVLAILAMLSGVVLGLRFRVLVLLPAICVLTLVTLGAGIANSSSAGNLLLAVVVAVAALQIGYLGGAVIRSAYAEQRTQKASQDEEIGVLPKPAH
jgi:hypothetical protein